MDLDQLRRESAQRVVHEAENHAWLERIEAFLIPAPDGKVVAFGTKEQIRALLGVGE